MRRTLLVAALALLIALPGSASAKAKGMAKAAPTTMSGEVVDMGCYMGHDAKGEKHKECATKCLNGGMPAGLLTAKGDLILLVMDHDKPEALGEVKGMAAEMVEVTGEMMKKHGMKAMSVAAVKKAEAMPEAAEKK